MKEVLIIGGGVAGLTAGICAQKKGYQALICEKHASPGGCLSFWERNGYHIDNCIHWLTGTNKNSGIHRLWEDLGVGDMPLYKRESLYVYEDENGRKAALCRDIGEFRRTLLGLSPADEKEIDRFIDAARGLMGYLGIGGERKDQRLRGRRMLRYLPGLLRYMRMSLSDLSRKFKDPTIGRFFISFLPEDFSALAYLFVAANFWGESADLPLGGSTEMARLLLNRFTESGGRIMTGAEAVKVNVEGDRAVSVTFKDGQTRTADYIILTADPKRVFGSLLDAEMPKRLKKNYRKLERFSAYQCAFSCDGYPPFDDEVTIGLPQELQQTLGARYALLRSDAHEKSYAPEGKTVFQILIYQNEAQCREFIRLRKEDPEGYRARKEELRNACAQALTAHYPELNGRFSALDLWTPATYERFVNSDVGSFMSFVFPKNVLPLKSDNRVPGLWNVLLAGQWLRLPGGLPIAADTGRDAVEQIARLETAIRDA